MLPSIGSRYISTCRGDNDITIFLTKKVFDRKPFFSFKVMSRNNFLEGNAMWPKSHLVNSTNRGYLITYYYQPNLTKLKLNGEIVKLISLCSYDAYIKYTIAIQ